MPRVNTQDTITLLEQKAVKCRDFKVTCKEMELSDSGNTITIQEVAYTLLGTGKSTLCRTLHMPGNYFVKYPISVEIDEHANIWFSKVPETEVLIRVLDGKVRAILPTNFYVFDYIQGLNAIMAGLKEEHEISLDIYDITDGQAVFNIIYGTELLLGPGLLPFVRFRGSEIGTGNLIVDTGIFNTVESSSIVIQSKKYGHIKWGYVSKGGRTLGSNITNNVKNSIINCRVMQSALVDAQKELLINTPANILKFLVEHKDISGRVANKLSEEVDICKPKTVYDFINMLMSNAQKNKSLNGRFKMEDLAGRILMDDYSKGV